MFNVHPWAPPMPTGKLWHPSHVWTLCELAILKLWHVGVQAFFYLLFFVMLMSVLLEKKKQNYPVTLLDSLHALLVVSLFPTTPTFIASQTHSSPLRTDHPDSVHWHTHKHTPTALYTCWSLHASPWTACRTAAC